MSEKQAKRRAGRPTADEAEQKRRTLIVTALEEFAKAGFHSASLRDIAQKAEISSRTLYNYYPDKLALFEACLEYSGRQIQPDPPEVNGDLHARLVDYATKMQRQLFTPLSMQIARLIYRDASDFAELRKIARVQFERHQVMPVAKMLDAHGTPSNTSQILARQFVAMALGEWQRRLLFGGDRMTLKEMASHATLVTTLFMEGIDSCLIERGGGSD
jgi:AcrR family transcriptional regulator